MEAPAGCQYQWAAWAWVFGIEGDGGPVDKQGQSNDQAPFNPQFVNQTNERSLATLRGRLGYAVDKWMFYATGGVAWARVEATAWDGCSVNASGVGGAVVSPGCGASIVGPVSRGCRLPRPLASRASTTSRPWSATP